MINFNFYDIFLSGGIFVKDKNKKKSAIKLNIQATPEDFKAAPADVVNLEFHNGYVIMNFLQTVGEGSFNEKNSTEVQSAVVMSRVMLSWEHFANTTQQMMYFMKQTQESAEFNHKQAVTFANNFGTDEEKSSDS